MCDPLYNILFTLAKAQQNLSQGWWAINYERAANFVKTDFKISS